jgi:hypothetical protein
MFHGLCTLRISSYPSFKRAQQEAAVVSAAGTSGACHKPSLVV